MLQLSGTLINRPVLSLRTGTQVATTVGPIINPNNLKIEGFYCQTAGRKTAVLVSQDVRDILPQGLVVNDQDVLTDPEELVRLKEVLKLNFELLGKQVFTASKQKLGKVNDYATETESLIIKKLYITQSLLKSFSGGNLGIDRTQIIEITDKKVIVNDLDAKVPAHAGAIA
jgi:uncharacterized protein YrrD